MENIEDPTNLTGLTPLLNKKHVDSNKNLDAIEKSIIGTIGMKKVKEIDPALELKRTIKELSENTGINLGDPNSDSGEESEKDKNSSNLNRKKNIGKKPKKKLKSDSESEEESGKSEEESGEELGESGGSEDEGSEDEESEDEESEDEGSEDEESEEGLGESEDESSEEEIKSKKKNKNKHKKKSRGNNNLDDVIKTYSGKNRGLTLEEENNEDIKNVILEDIDELVSELKQDGLDMSKFEDIDKNSHIDDIKKIHGILRKKYDRKRCNSFGTECILAGAQGLEWLFDGKKKWGPYSPDLKGWSNTIRPKLRQMKYETSNVVAKVMNDYNIGDLTRIALNLGPSAILYSKMRKNQHGTSNYNPEQMSEAFENLREYDT